MMRSQQSTGLRCLRVAAIAGLAATPCGAYAGDSAVSIRKVAALGDQAPGVEAGTTFGSLDSCLIGTATIDQGDIGFSALLEGPAVTNDTSQGLWIRNAGGTRLLARSGVQAPGLPQGVAFAGFPYAFVTFPPVLNGGRAGFAASLAGPGVTFSNDSSAWVELNNSFSLIAREGDQAPGLTTGTLFSEVGVPALDPAGNAALRLGLIGTGVTADNDLSFWVRRDSALTMIAREGQQAPGVPAGVRFGQGGIGAAYQFAESVFNSDLDVLFTATLAGPGVDAFSDEGLFRYHDGQLTKVLREGEPAPGFPHAVTFGGGSVYLFVHSLAMNDAGQYVFHVRLGGAMPTTDVVFSNYKGDLAPVVTPNAAAPGAGTNFGIVSTPRLSNSGRIAFRASLAGAGSWPPFGVWWDQRGELEVLVLPGAAVPNRPGFTFTGINFINGYAADGYLAFSGAVLDGQTHRDALFIATPEGDIHLVAAQGLPIDIEGDGAPRIVSSINVHINALDEGGALAFRLRFDDGGTGHYIATLGAPPCSADFDNDGDTGTDSDIEAFFACLGGHCCAACGSADFDSDGDTGTDSDIETFFRVLSGGAC